jgi:hypothetical protein
LQASNGRVEKKRTRPVTFFRETFDQSVEKDLLILETSPNEHPEVGVVSMNIKENIMTSIALRRFASLRASWRLQRPFHPWATAAAAEYT